jgi:hypothetical protein
VAGVKGAAPLVAPAGAKSPLQKAKVTSNVKEEKQNKKSKAQFKSNKKIAKVKVL